MSNEEKISFKKIENYGFRLSVMQAITLLSVLLSGFLWYNGRDEKQLIDGMSLHNQIKDLANEVRNTHIRDSVSGRRIRVTDSVATQQRRQSDSVNFVNLARHINFNSNRLNKVEQKLHISFVEEVKQHGPDGPVSLKGVSN